MSVVKRIEDLGNGPECKGVWRMGKGFVGGMGLGYLCMMSMLRHEVNFTPNIICA